MVNVSKGRTPEYWKEYQRQYRLNNADRIKHLQSIRQKELLPEILMNRKGLSEVEKFYVIEHDGVCEICGGPPTGRTKRLSIDHDHATGAFRGMLCGHCNTGLGMFKDNPILLEKAIYYLNRKTLPGECQ
jgi:hypothetical protein